MRTTRITWYGALLLLLVLLFTACAENKDDIDTVDNENGNGTDETDFSPVDSVILTASNQQLPSASTESDQVTITVYVRDENNRGMEDVEVSVAASNDGYWEPVDDSDDLFTDANGTIEILLSTPINKANRDITVTATSGGVSGDITIQVTGTNLDISGTNSATLGETATLNVTLLDSEGDAITNASLVNPDGDADLTFDSAAGNTITPLDSATNSIGQADVEVSVENVTATNEDTITVSGYGTLALHTFNITTDSFSFIKPDPTVETEVDLGVEQELTVEWQEEGNPVVGGDICFATNRGKFLDSNEVTTRGTTNDNGQTTVSLAADSAGGATVTANAGCLQEGLEASVELLFVATEVDKLTLQANPNVVGNGEQSTLTAVIRDPDNNPVKNILTTFSVEADVTGGTVSPTSAYTDRYGMATSIYTAGAAGTGGRDDAVIAANADGLNPEDVTVTVAGEALYITIAYADVVEIIDDKRYRLPATVMVTDSSGHSVEGVEVALALWPTHYHKGSYLWDDENGRWVQVITTYECDNEDVARSGNIDDPLNVDINENGELDPGTVASISSESGGYTVTTDAGGFADFTIDYAKQFAWWAEVEITANAQVADTESTRRSYRTLPIVGDDLTDRDKSPAGNPSPFGTATSCDDPS